MEEPTNPEHYYIFSGVIELDGKKGYGKVKKWYDKDIKEFKERILVFQEEK